MEVAQTINDQEKYPMVQDVKQDNPHDEVPSMTQAPPLFFSKRLMVTAFLFFSFVNFQILKNNINIAIIEMTSNKTIKQGNLTIVQPPEFDWDSPTKRFVITLASFGGIFGFFNGFVVENFGPSAVIAANTLLAGLLTILHPAALNLNFYAFLALRFLIGFMESGFSSSTAEMFARWFPVNEKSTLIAWSFNGFHVGIAIVYLSCGFLAHIWGWRIIFYVTGVFSVIFSILFFVYVKSHPSQDKGISKAELAYILQDNESGANDAIRHGKHNQCIKSKFINVFKPILTSKPIWAALLLLITYTWIDSAISVSLPLYFRDRTGKESDEIGYLSSIPNAVYMFLLPMVGAFMDFWKNHSNITFTKLHKIMVCSNYALSMILFTGITFFSEVTTTVVFFVLIQICTSAIPLLIPIIILSSAPNHVSHIVSILPSCALLGVGGSQMLAGFMIRNHTLQEWNNTFYINTVVALFGGVFFFLFGSSEPQPWSVFPSGK